MVLLKLTEKHFYQKHSSLVSTQMLPCVIYPAVYIVYIQGFPVWLYRISTLEFSLASDLKGLRGALGGLNAVTSDLKGMRNAAADRILPTTYSPA